jgi:hypothetical protein
MQNSWSYKISTIYIYMCERNICSILNTSNKEMLLKLRNTMEGQGPHTSVRIYSSGLRKDLTQWTWNSWGKLQDTYYKIIKQKRKSEIQTFLI